MMKKMSILLFFINMLLFSLRAYALPPVVEIASGKIEGTSQGGIVSFKGIPFAQPPVGELRWRAPQPVKPWKGVKDATQFGKSCMQTDDIPKSEDCLTLNVWSPTLLPNKPLPVMVWIYGGALAHGNTPLYKLDEMARQGVVAVSMNYRLGRLGFFLHPALIKESPAEPHGNYGYLDQLAALKWVKENIHAFGGDPEQVTIFGESAGGGSVLVHLSSPLSQGLFQRAILQSPGLPTGRSSVLPLTTKEAAEASALQYTQSLGIDAKDASALTALRALPAEKLVEGASAEQVLASLASGKPIAGVVGSMVDGKLLIDAPEHVFMAGKQAKVPLLLGANSQDLGLGIADSKEALFSILGDAAAEGRKLYDPLGWQSVAQVKQKLLADKTLIEPTRHLADIAVKAGQPVYLYRFSYVAEALRGKQKGTLHGFEIPYIMDLPSALVGDKVTADDKEIAKVASAYWVDFAKTGNPNGEGRTSWPRYSPNQNLIVNFTNDGVILGTDPFKNRLDVVEKSYYKQRP